MPYLPVREEHQVCVSLVSAYVVVSGSYIISQAMNLFVVHKRSMTPLKDTAHYSLTQGLLGTHKADVRIDFALSLWSRFYSTAVSCQKMSDNMSLRQKCTLKALRTKIHT